jgi:hypothetical protein
MRCDLSQLPHYCCLREIERERERQRKCKREIVREREE